MAEQFAFCPLCGAPLDGVVDEKRERMRCGSCGYMHYRNPAPAAGVIVLDTGRVLLVRRKYEPYRGQWVIPSGFIEYDEDVRDTARRELLEETGLEIDIVSLHAVESCFDDPRGMTLLVLYRGRVTGGTLIAGDDADEVRFFALDELPEIAFEAHRVTLAALAAEAAAPDE
jgi:ADP-ribose pyrophosphatase YjhB (NUDIX family)